MTDKHSRSKNAMKMTQRFASYLEKHRIFELFQELSMMLLIKKPEDHLLFLKQSICHAARRLDVPRIILLAPPEFDKQKLAEDLREKLRIPLITLGDIVDEASESVLTVAPGELVKKLRKILVEYIKFDLDGWIFIDFPKTEEEARYLQRNGIIPSHVIEVIPSGVDRSSSIGKFPISDEYHNGLRGLRHVFSKTITQIYYDDYNIEEIIQKCLDVVKYRKYPSAPAVFRILLIDFSGSTTCKCLGAYLAAEFNIVHIDFDTVLKRISLQDTELGDRVRESLQICKSIITIPNDVRVQAFEQTIFQSDCMKYGWVLTGFVHALDDFKCLDMTDAPPNRVFIITKNQNYSQTESDSTGSGECPCEANVDEVIKYAGKSAYVIQDDLDLREIKEKIGYRLMQPPPCVPPRSPQPPPIIDFEKIEFDPDDEPSTEILADIREREPSLPLI